MVEDKKQRRYMFSSAFKREIADALERGYTVMQLQYYCSKYFSMNVWEHLVHEIRKYGNDFIEKEPLYMNQELREKVKCYRKMGVRTQRALMDLKISENTFQKCMKPFPEYHLKKLNGVKPRKKREEKPSLKCTTFLRNSALESPLY